MQQIVYFAINIKLLDVYEILIFEKCPHLTSHLTPKLMSCIFFNLKGIDQSTLTKIIF